MPAAGVFAAVYILGNYLFGMSVAVVLAALAAAIILALEVATGVFLLGHAFARFDAGEGMGAD